VEIRWLQHVPFEGLGRIEDWARSRGVLTVPHRLYAGDPLPDPGKVEFLVVMGGPMSVNDGIRFPWLVDEKELIGDVVWSGKPVFGVCLGAQLIAAALGSEVF